ncbi:MAG: PAS domain S-box protein [Anaerolineae bacterium]|nr:PAS domain S-box protein [Anaerolineae bacterium]NIN97412.1 PAS domain S-box protein [Anaerolineae bacterium]NIQ80341.1 PAS domain S-box protein [Anaerolineae bacterium]
MEVQSQPGERFRDELLAAVELIAQSDVSDTEPERAWDAPVRESAVMSRATLLDRVGALVIIVDQQNRVRWFNKMCHDTVGLSFEDVWGRHFWDVLAVPEEADAVKSTLENVRRGVGPPAYVSHLVAQDGASKLFYWCAAPLFDGEGSTEHIIGVGIDITDREDADELLGAGGVQYRRLVESSPYAMLVHYGGTIIFTNRAGANLLGASDPGEIVGRPVLDFIHPDRHEVVKARLDKVHEHGTELALVEDKLVRLDGSVVRVDAHSIFPFMYQDKPAIQVVAREITDTRRAEPEAEAPYLTFETLLKISSDAVTTTDLRGRITQVSQGALDLFGHEDATELLGGSTFQLVVAEDHEELIRSLQQTFKEGIVRNLELVLLRKDGSQFDGSLDMALIRDAEGKPRGFVATAQDLTEPEAPAFDAQVSHREGEESSALLKASRAVLAYRDFGRAARAIFDACKNLIGAGAGYVGLMNEDATKDNIWFSQPTGFSWAAPLSDSRRLRELRAEVYLTGKAMYLNRLLPAAGVRPTGDAQPAVANILFAPLAVNDNTVGLLSFANKPGGFTEEDARVASAFAELAAVSLASTRALQALEASEERFRSVAEATADAIVTFDSDGHIVSWNPGAEAIFGYSGNEMIGKRLTLVAPVDLRDAYKDAVQAVEGGGDSNTLAEPKEMIGRRKDGSTFPLELSFTGWKTGQGVFLTSIIRDITERKLAEHDLQLLADHDHLTGLPNRALFRDHLTQALAKANREPQGLAVMTIDLDRFKAINHALGLQAGDQLLQAVGDRLTGEVRTGDSVARSGDDEFVLLLSGMDAPEHADRVGQRILRALRQPFAIDGREVRITASIGVALYPEHGDDIDTLMKRADTAMSGAKDKGRDTYQRFSATLERGAEESPRPAPPP